MKGWMQVNGRTAVLFVDGKPVRLRSTARDLDAATDAAAQYVGEPLDTGEWAPERAAEGAPWVCDCRLASEAIAEDEAKR